MLYKFPTVLLLNLATALKNLAQGWKFESLKKKNQGLRSFWKYTQVHLVIKALEFIYFEQDI